MKLVCNNRRIISVQSLKEASEVFQKFIERGQYLSSELAVNAGNVIVGERLIATVSYNGRVWTPDDYPHSAEIII